MPDQRFAELAQRAYRAYGDQAEWANPEGDPMPQWPDLGERVQSCWLAAAEAVYTRVGPPIMPPSEE